MVQKSCYQEQVQRNMTELKKISHGKSEDVTACWQELKCTQQWFCPTSPFFHNERFELECIQLYFPND